MDVRFRSRIMILFSHFVYRVFGEKTHHLTDTPNDLFVVYQKRNIFRFLFVLIKRSGGVDFCGLILLQSKRSVGLASTGYKLFSQNFSRAYLRTAGKDVSSQSKESLHADFISEIQGFLGNIESFKSDISLIKVRKANYIDLWRSIPSFSQQIIVLRSFWRKVLENPAFLQILFIPYVILFGYFFTNIFFQCGGDLFIYNLSSGGINFGKRFIMTYFILGSELLRGAHYASKIFLVWSFLTIWKGIRPGQSAKNEYSIQVRMNFKRKKKLSDLEGISKYYPLLKTCIQSLKYPPLSSRILTYQRWVYTQFRESISALSRFTRGISALRSGEPAPQHPVHFMDAGISGSPVHPGSYAYDNISSENRGIGDTMQQRRFTPLPRLQATKPPINVSVAYRNYQKPLGFEYPKGYLFVGPPGTGKTLLAQAVAGEAGVPFIALSASEIQKQISLGTKIGAVRLRNLFLKAKQHTPCILFFDEIDSIAGRGSIIRCMSKRQSRQQPDIHNEKPIAGDIESKTLSHDFAEKAVSPLSQSPPRGDITLFTEFLIQMDSVQAGLVIIGTTNFLNNLDSAFIRSGRFDRIINLTYPGKSARFDLFRLYIGKRGSFSITDFSKIPDALISTSMLNKHAPIDSGGLKKFVQQTEGWTAADIATVVNESLLYLQRIYLNKLPFRWQGPKILSLMSYLRHHLKQRQTIPLWHTYHSLTEGMKKLSTRVYTMEP